MKMQHKDALETFKIFPYVAWGLTFIFALFVYNIARELQVMADDLQRQTEELKVRVNTPVHEITDFDPKKSDRNKSQ